ncbi:transglycosylase domain-containing protein [Gemelliphila palaticanis]|uniref:Penicillin-binding protein n=1 Tax=Gemelliphila palaticanis TaxID=81950 RepID=A0ABX2SY31_9BACL|nr:transglycosylase domain-containing protein [Gemella palaticanis]MBF0714781.1 penicillin-binding protein [Gemella palaticanis]NYS46711.1 penicillin-binding protein [Gemella palaticanis]
MKIKSIKYQIMKYITLFIILSLAFFISLAIGFAANLVKDQKIMSYEEMKEEINNISENSDVYFSNGEKVATINYELMRKTIPLHEMGDNIKNAIIASEDSNFYSNNGIEYTSLIRATFNEATGKSNSGGSTITQQLVKNQLLDSSRSYERKAKEILLAIRVNRYFSKNEILEAYLNMAPFGKNKLGQNISGIETASMGIFGVKTMDLNIAQAAYLAGFVQSPFKYTPFNNNGDLRPDEELKYGFDRQKYVLDRMLTVKFITKTEYDEALKFDIKSSFINELYDERGDYPYIVNEVISSASEILAEQVAKENNDLDKFNTNTEFRNSLIEKSRIKFVTGGYKVKTTINKELYNKLEEAKNNYSGFISKNIKGNIEPMQIGATLIENKSGKILAFIGGNDYKKQQLNHATRTYRSPGSTIKPLLVYAPAIEKGYITPNSLLLDKRFNYNGWKPENFTKLEYGILSAKDALAKSLNLSTIRLYSAFLNEDPVAEYLQKMDFKNIIPSDHQTLAAAIGGLAYGFSVTENTNAFATFANEGKFQKAYIIEEISDNKNNIVYKYNKEAKQVYSKETSYLIVNMLNRVLSANGTAPDIAASLKFNISNIFVKTGTSEFNHDLWTVGGTKNITFGLWTGYDTPSEINGYQHAHNQWAYFMNVINDYDKVLVGANEKFEIPNTVKNIGVNPINNSKGSTIDLVPDGFYPLDNNKLLRKFGINVDNLTIKYLNSEEDSSDNDKNSSDKDSSDKIEDDKSDIKNDDKPTNSNKNEENVVIVKPSEIIIEENDE